MSASRATLVYMANQIARNLATMGEADAVAATAEHLRAYWDPRMKEALIRDQTGLDPLAAAAVALLCTR